MIEVALFATIAYILDLVTQPMSLGPWISLSFKMVPIFLLSNHHQRLDFIALFNGFIKGWFDHTTDTNQTKGDKIFQKTLC